MKCLRSSLERPASISTSAPTTRPALHASIAPTLSATLRGREYRSIYVVNIRCQYTYIVSDTTFIAVRQRILYTCIVWRLYLSRHHPARAPRQYRPHLVCYPARRKRISSSLTTCIVRRHRIYTLLVPDPPPRYKFQAKPTSTTGTYDERTTF